MVEGQLAEMGPRNGRLLAERWPRCDGRETQTVTAEHGQETVAKADKSQATAKRRSRNSQVLAESQPNMDDREMAKGRPRMHMTESGSWQLTYNQETAKDDRESVE